MSFINKIKERAKSNIKTIVLPETEDLRILTAAQNVLKEKVANVILIGNEEDIKIKALENELDLEEATIIEPIKSEKYEQYVQTLFELRQSKGMTIEEARELVKDTVYFGMLMVKDEESAADGLVSGAIHSTADTLRPALQILKTSKETKLVSAFFIMCVQNENYGENGTFIFSDCGLNENPGAIALSEIAISSSRSFKQLIGDEPRVGMLSYSTYGSAKSEATEKVIKAVEMIKRKEPGLIVDGELQLDAAIVPEIADIKAPGSPLKAKANILVFPDLNSGNIGYKLVQRLGNAEAYGPVCQGISKPVNDLSRGCNYKDVEGVIAITAVQAQVSEK